MRGTSAGLEEYKEAHSWCKITIIPQGPNLLLYHVDQCRIFWTTGGSWQILLCILKADEAKIEISLLNINVFALNISLEVYFWFFGVVIWFYQLFRKSLSNYWRCSYICTILDSNNLVFGLGYQTKVISCIVVTLVKNIFEMIASSGGVRLRKFMVQCSLQCTA